MVEVAANRIPFALVCTKLLADRVDKDFNEPGCGVRLLDLQPLCVVLAPVPEIYKASD